MSLMFVPPHGLETSGKNTHTYAAVFPDSASLIQHVQTDPNGYPATHIDLARGGATSPHDRNVLQRLTLNVSNVCNMACKYCYANGGKYYTPGGMMDKFTALNAVNFVTRRFAQIQHVNFFGGEPTLNEAIIKLVCEYFLFLYGRGELPYVPAFGLTTNGYFISDDMFEVLRAYNIGVTVSMDGPREIHDRLRVVDGHSGSFDLIDRNVRTLIGMDIRPEFECTYTSEHYRCGFDLLRLMDFFYDSYDCHVLHCPIVVAQPNSQWAVSNKIVADLYTAAIRSSVSNLWRGIPKSISFAARLLDSLATRTPIAYYCPAGKSTLTINTDGNIFACFMLMPGPAHCLGNVNADSPRIAIPERVGAILNQADKWSNPACQHCWAQGLCFGCLGEDLVQGMVYPQGSTTHERSQKCDTKRLIEVFLYSVGDAFIQRWDSETRKRVEDQTVVNKGSGHSGNDSTPTTE